MSSIDALFDWVLIRGSMSDDFLSGSFLSGDTLTDDGLCDKDVV